MSATHLDAHPAAAPAPRRPPVWRRPRYRALQRVQRSLFGRAFVDRNRDERATVYVAGGGKSGTTWIAEFINYRNDHRFMFEPLTPPYIPAFAAFVRGQYLRAGAADPAYTEPLRHLLTGRLRHWWMDHLNCVPVAQRRLVKDVHANLLLHWVHCNMPGVRIVLIVRHPLAVIASRLATAPVVPYGQFDPELERFLRQDALMEDFLWPYERVLRDASTLVEQHACWWCIETLVPLRQFAAGDIHTLCYEWAHWQPNEELARLGEYLQRPFDDRVVRIMQRPSRTAGYGSALSRGEDPALSWRRRLSADDVRGAMRIVSRFGLDAMYSDLPQPLVADPGALMRQSAQAVPA